MLVNLITWEYCHKLLELDPRDKAQIELIIFSCSAEIEAYTGRILKDRDIREIRDGMGQNEITLQQYPVKELTRLIVDNDRNYPEENIISKEYYTCHIPQGNDNQENPSEVILISGYTFPRGKRNIEILYKAGYPEDSLPEDLKMATLELLEWTLKRLRNHQVGEVNLKYGQKTRISTTMPDHVTKLLEPFRRKSW